MLRMARPEDWRAIAEVHVRAFDETHGPGPSVEVRQAQWAAILGASDRDFTLVWEDDGAIVGFARGIVWAEPDADGFEATLNKIYVLRGYQGRGIGRVLFEATLSEFRRQGVRSVRLFGDPGLPANGFYQRLGGTRTLSPEGEFHGGWGWRW